MTQAREGPAISTAEAVVTAGHGDVKLRASSGGESTSRREPVPPTRSPHHDASSRSAGDDLRTLHERLKSHPDRLVRVVGHDGTVLTRTYSDLHADVIAQMSELQGCGLGRGDLVGILGANSYNWIVTDLALLGLECISVAFVAENKARPADPEQLAEKYMLNALLISAEVNLVGPLPPWSATFDRGPVTLCKRDVGPGRPEMPADVFTIAFSSGTAGSTKGLLMSKAGVLNTIEVSAGAWRVEGEDNIAVVMPFSSFQQRYLGYLAFWVGCDLTVIPPERMFQKMKVLEPTVIVGPPSFFEVLYNRIRAARRRDKLGYYLAAVLHAVAPAGITRALRARLGARWTAMYGSRVRLLLTGSAPVPSRVVKLFHQIGAPLFEVYGSTEIGWIAFNLPAGYRIGRAGRPVDGVNISIADDGEVLARPVAPQALGYIFDGAETENAVFLADGTIITGDLGRLDRAGFLQLQGRKKNVIITRSGVKINPEQLEQDLENNCQLTKAVIVLSGQGASLTCVAWLDDPQALGRRQAIERYVASSGKRMEWHQVARVVFRPDSELTVESGLLTRNLKVDRDAVIRTLFSGGNGATR